MSTTNLTPFRLAVEHLARSIDHHDLAGLMPPEIREHTRMHQLIEQACATIMDDRAPDELICGCATDLVKLLKCFQQEGILFERVARERVPRLLRKIHIRSALRAAARELDLVREVLV